MPSERSVHASASSSDLPQALNREPTLASSSNDWSDMVLQRFQDLPDVIDLPAMRDEVLVCHLAGPFLAETAKGTPNFERRWIDSDHLGVNPSGMPVHRTLKGKPDVALLLLPTARLHAVAEEMFDTDPARIELVPRLGERDETAAHLMRLLLAEAECGAAGTPLMVETLSRALTVHVLRRHSNLSPQRPHEVVGLSPGHARRVIDHMKTHLDKPLSLADLAKVGALSPSRFARAFRDATGEPPHRFLVRLRVETACRLLEETDLTVIEVGLRCGFEQPSHFAAMFRKAVGLSPRAWRSERRA